MSPILIIVAGPNGAGKTTVTTTLRRERWSTGVEYLNPDDVALSRFGDWNSPEATLAAAQGSMANLRVVLPSVDRAYLFDNSVDHVDARLCARTVGGTLRKIYGPLPRWVSDNVAHLPHHSEFVDIRVA